MWNKIITLYKEYNSPHIKIWRELHKIADYAYENRMHILADKLVDIAREVKSGK